MSNVKPEFSKAAGSKFPGSDKDYNNAVWNAVEVFGRAAVDGRTLNALNIDDRDFKKAYDFTYPKP